MRGGVLVVLAVVAFPSAAGAAPVLVLAHDGRVSRHDDRFLSGPAITPVPGVRAPGLRSPGLRAPGVRSPGLRSPGLRSPGLRSPGLRSPGLRSPGLRSPGLRSPGARSPGLRSPGVRSPGVRAPGVRSSAVRRAVRRGGAGPSKRKPQVTVGGVLGKLRRSHAITPALYGQALGAFNGALAAERHLGGTRRTELSAVTESVHNLAAGGQLTPSRLPAVIATLNVNHQWWTRGSLLGSGARVELAGSQLVWEYYPGQGIQLQVLGSFGKADGLYTGGAADYPAMEQLLSEIIPLAAQRAGGLTWEYYFTFDGGAPPWTSAMSQATGLEALSRAYEATRNPYYLQVAARAMGVFTRPPPAGVTVPTALGARFLQYTFAPRVSIINAFLQTLIGLYDYAQIGGNPLAARLFAQGNAEAMAEVPSFDTGAWSLYQPGVEDSLSYHELVTGFLQELCTRTAAPVYCTTAQRFTDYLKTPPVVGDRTARARAGHGFSLRFSLSKASRVGVVITRGGSAVYATSASFPYGDDSFPIPSLRPAGTYAVRLAATDRAGNFARTDGTLIVTR